MSKANLSTPLLIIDADRGSNSLDPRGVWQYRELLYFLAWRDVKIRYKQTALGVVWAVVQPLLAMLIFNFVFGVAARIPSDGMPYALFAYAGLLPWTFFTNAVSNSGNSLVSSSQLITKVYFPRVIIPCASVAAALVDFIIASLFFVPLMVWYRIPLTTSVLIAPGLIVVTSLFSLAIGMCFSALNVRYRDIRHAIPFVMQLWMFATPVIYPSTMLPGRSRWILVLNPMSGVIEGFRISLLAGKTHTNFNWVSIGFSATITIISLIVAIRAFNRMEASFADVI